MPLCRLLAALAVALGLAAPAAAQSIATGFGPDRLAAGQDIDIAQPVPGDAWLAGNLVALRAEVGRHLHIAGGSVRVGSPVGGSVYAAGNSVLIDAAVGESVWAAGNNVVLRGKTRVAVRTRLAGNNLRIAGRLDGDLKAAGSRVEIAGTIAGNVHVEADELVLADGARIRGNLTYLTRQRVADAGRHVDGQVSYRAQEAQQKFQDAEEPESGFWGTATTLLAGVAVLLIVAGLVLVALPRFTAQAQRTGAATPLTALGSGLIMVLVLICAIVVLGVTLIGIPVVVLLLLAAPLGLAMAYGVGALGAASWAWQLRTGEVPDQFGGRLALTGAGTLVAALLGLIPGLGWLLHVLVLVLGLGIVGQVWVANRKADRPS